MLKASLELLNECIDVDWQTGWSSKIGITGLKKIRERRYGNKLAY